LSGDPKLPAEEHHLVRDKTAARERAALDLARTSIRAPVDGVVVNMRVQQGEQVKAATPLFVLVVVSRPWVEANFKETELTLVRTGQQAIIKVDTYPDAECTGRVASIAQATGAEFAVLPPQNASGNWVKVVQRIPMRVRLDTSDKSLPPLRAGMSVEVNVDTGHARGLPRFLTALVGHAQRGT
jgi:membrane fusion protein (multidrug efflux system)